MICYDVSDDRRRARPARLLDGYGRRVQYSVYEAVLDRVLFDNLLARILSVIDAGADRVAVYALCAACAGRRVGLGTAGVEWPGDEVVLVV